MKIAIHHAKTGFSEGWIEYCKQHHIAYKLVNCYSSSIISDVDDCQAIMWHHSHSRGEDILIARQVLSALEHKGLKVFPNFRTAWYFDDKLGQKYLFEALNLQHAKVYVFVKKEEALRWTETTSWPKVFKLRGGAGSSNVSLVKSKASAQKLIHRAFGRGFRNYDAWNNLTERVRKYREGNATLQDIVKGIARMLVPPEFARVKGKERGYVYFQDFVPGNDHDIRVVVIKNKAFAIKRLARSHDFRASGSGQILFEKKHFNADTIKTAFQINNAIGSQCLVLDFVHQGHIPYLIEISYGFSAAPYHRCEGYWDSSLNWHPGKFDFLGWMVESTIGE